MVHRTYWQNRIEDAWTERSIIWLSGVRRVGKTCLCQSLSDVEHFDCERPTVRAKLAEPETFLGRLSGKRIVLDEVHRLPNPSELLKIAADYYPTTRVLATGSSTLGVSRKFRDTLTGRKTELWLTPLISADMRDFGVQDLEHRLLRGGLPPFLLATNVLERAFEEWYDSFWARDIQELFRLERRYSFAKFAEMLMTQSSGIFEATKFAAACEASRGTISNYLAVMEATSLIHVIRPFSTHRPTEIVAAPKVYGFDTGFVCHSKGWRTLRQEDLGPLWEHLVLNELVARLQTRYAIKFWRSKHGHEVDFIIPRRGDTQLTIECKWSSDGFDPANVLAFRRQYPNGDNLVVAHDVDTSFLRRYEGVSVTFVGIEEAGSLVAG